MYDAPRPPVVTFLGVFEPVTTVVVGAEEATMGDMLEGRELGEAADEFLVGKVERIVVDVLGRIFKGLEEEADLAEIASFPT